MWVYGVRCRFLSEIVAFSGGKFLRRRLWVACAGVVETLCSPKGSSIAESREGGEWIRGGCNRGLSMVGKEAKPAGSWARSLDVIGEDEGRTLTKDW
jgi:hypothetical protein